MAHNKGREEKIAPDVRKKWKSKRNESLRKMLRGSKMPLEAKWAKPYPSLATDMEIVSAISDVPFRK